MRSETFSVPAHGCTLRVRRSESEGFPALLVHGGPGGIDYLYKFFARPLANLGYRAISYVQRGSAGSECDGPFTIEQFVHDLEILRERLELDKFALVGHSWGGLLSTLYSARHPERVARLTLICPIGARNGWRDAFDEELETRMPAGDFERWHDLEERALAAHDPADEARLMVERLNIGVRYYYGSRFRDRAPGLAFLEWRVRKAILSELDALYADPAWERGLLGFAAPCALITGEEDPLPDSVTREYLDLFPNAWHAGMNEVGHFPWMEKPEEFFPLFHEAMQSGW